MASPRIDLYSDTQTRPTQGMREAIARAEVGDEQRGDDPSVNRLCETVAALLGKERAVFMPSGTMCNEIAIRVHCRAGDEILADATSHIIHFEGGGPAALTGACVQALHGERGVYTAEQLEAAIRTPSRYAPTSRLVEVEQTANMGGGTVWPLAAIESVAGVARAHGLSLHLDGARLLNAVVASGVTARAFAAPFDSAWIDLSKGLGCPAGGVLAGSEAFVAEAWRWKQRLGGAMRQAGILAAAGSYALEHHVERLAEDHANARHLAAGLAACPGVSIDLESVHTNLVFFDVAGTGVEAGELCGRLAARGVHMGAFGRSTMRACTHLDVSAGDVERALAIFSEVAVSD